MNLSPPIIFLFGGTIASIGDPPVSVRGCLYDYIFTKHPALSNNLVIPEDFKDWLHDSIYPDLLSFESDLAQTSALVIIALESPGSIAELGSFSVNPALRNKLIIIISEFHHSQKSFITLGPLRQIPEENIYSYPYSHERLGTTLNVYLEDIVLNINNNLAKINKTEKFDVNNNGHISLLICELLLMFKALKLKEIQHYLELLSINKKLSVTKRLLFLLEKLELIVKKRLGNMDFFIPANSNQRVSFASIDKHKLFDRTSSIIGTSSYYASSAKEKMRKRIIGL